MSEPLHHDHTTRLGALAAVVATTAVLTLASMTALTPAAIAPELARARGLPSALIGLQVSLVYAGAMLSSLVGGTTMRRLGACRSSQIALLALAAGAALASLPSTAALALASLVIGLGYGLTNPAASHVLMRFTSARHRNLIFSIKQTGVPLGGVLAGLLAPRLTLGAGLYWTFLSLALACAGLALLLQAMRRRWDDDREPGTPIARHPFAGVALVWRSPGLRWISMTAMCFSAIQLCLSAFTVTLLVEDVGFGLVAAGSVMSAVQVAGVAGRLAWGWLADRLRNGPLTLTLCALLSGSGCLLVTLLTPDWPAQLVAATLVALALAAIGWNGVYLAEVARRSRPGEVAMATGGSLVFTYSGVLVGPSVFAALHGVAGSYTVTFGVLVLAALGAGLFTRAAARDRPGD